MLESRKIFEFFIESLYKVNLTERTTFHKLGIVLRLCSLRLRGVSESERSDYWEREMGADRNLGYWIFKSADYLQPIKIVFRAYTVGGILLCVLHHAVNNDGLYIMCNTFGPLFMFL